MLRTLGLFSTKLISRNTLLFSPCLYRFCSSSQKVSSIPKDSLSASDLQSHYTTLFKRINLETKLINNTLPNTKLSKSLAHLCQNLDVSACDKRKGLLLYSVASKLINFPGEKQELLARYILLDKIQSQQQLDRAIDFAKGTTEGPSSPEFIAKLEKHCGIGVIFTEDAIKKSVQEYLNSKRETILTEEGNKDKPILPAASHLKVLRELLPGADGSALYKIFSEEFDKIAKQEETQEEETTEKEAQKRFSASRKIFNLFARDITSSVNPPEILKKHLEATGGKIVTRFPPEPNGFLHLGHAKAMRFSFMAAKEQEGLCYLRYDDTNPLTESVEYIRNIEENVRWLGYQPYKVTHASDYFQEMFDFAVELIKKGKAYICEQKQEEMQAYRAEKKPSPWRDRSPEESLDFFLRMKAGEFEESRYCLRLKIDYANENPTLRDPVAFRVKKHPHPQTGNKWCIFPTYDFAHCLSDSLENITHSLCTLEFEIRRDLYYWTLENLNIYRPMVWEFSRLNITRTILSKRKLNRLVQAGIVKGWDDPRLLTINGMRRRGFVPSGINSFCDEISVTRRGNETMVSIKLLEHCMRRDLDQSSPRAMAVLSPLKVVVKNLAPGETKEVDVYPFPKDKNKEKPYKVSFTQEIYIEKTDFREEENPNFFGLVPGGLVGLRYAGFIRCDEVIKNEQGEVVEIRAQSIEPKSLEEIEEFKKVKGRIHWISAEEAIDCEARLYEYLFTADNPNEAENFMDVVNKDSLKVINTLKFNKRLLSGLNKESRFQFERLGFFCVDLDSDIQNGKLVFNRTLELNEKDKIKAIGKE